jgi:hypothetical protein
MEERFVKAYMGENYETFNSSKNYDVTTAVAGVLIGPAMFFYYGCYLVGFGALFCQLVGGMILTTIIPATSSFFSTAIGIAYGYLIFPLYNWDARRKVEKIINKHPNLSDEELEVLLSRKGGKKLHALILYILGFLGFIALYIFLLFAQTSVKL